MTQNPLEKLLLLAVAAGMSVGEFRSAINSVHAAGPSEIEDLYKRMRNRLRHLEDDLADRDRGEVASPVRSDVLNLARAAALPPRIAAERLAEQLHRGDPLRQLPPFNQKEGLTRWVERVLRVVGDSALLNAAVAAFSSAERHPGSWTLGRS